MTEVTNNRTSIRLSNYKCAARATYIVSSYSRKARRRRGERQFPGEKNCWVSLPAAVLTKERLEWERVGGRSAFRSKWEL